MTRSNFRFSQFDVFSELVVVLDAFAKPGAIPHCDHPAVTAVFQLENDLPVDRCSDSRFHCLTALSEMHRAFTFNDIKRLIRL